MINERAYKEAIEQWEEDWDDNYDNLLEQYGNEFLDSQNRFDDILYDFNEFEDYLNTLTPYDAFQLGVNATINWSDDYYYFDGYANVHTEYDAARYFKCIINEDEFKRFILENDYFDEYPEEDDFEEDDEENDNTTDNN